MISITHTGGGISFVPKEGSRLDFGVSACGYVTVYDGPACIFKKELSEIYKISVVTEKGRFNLRPIKMDFMKKKMIEGE